MSMFAALERSTVQLVEAKRFAAHGDPSYSRLALLLLDNAAELSLLRTARSALLLADQYAEMGGRLDEAELGGLSESLQATIRLGNVSARRRKKIEREFDALVDFVAERGRTGLAPEVADCLKILHRFRNGAYHREEIRADIIDSAVLIYFFLCCELLADERHPAHQLGTPGPVIAAILGDLDPAKSRSGFAYDTMELRKLIAARLREDLSLDHATVTRALSQHLNGRLSVLDRRLETITDFFERPPRRSTVLRIIQFGPDSAAGPLPADFWTRKLPVTEATLENWQSSAHLIAKASHAHDGLRSFARIESVLEQFEEQVEPFIEEIDRQEELWRER